MALVPEYALTNNNAAGVFCQWRKLTICERGEIDGQLHYDFDNHLVAQMFKAVFECKYLLICCPK